ncbi:RNA polymerase sigma factor [Burkholderia anthina]|uniref:RNA polymerase sigma factor n=1 Tax=Burkholderia anthina TaxID=179879 RepID=UPI00158CB9CA|nr:RNA polymerase sigma factor [Burkholderia anthina]
MAEDARTRLRTLFVAKYAHLRRRLEFIVGSRDGAADAMQETWLRLDTMNDPAQIANADAYLLRMAANVAIDQHRREQRHLSTGDVDALFEVGDELAEPDRIVSARRDIEALQQVLDTLPSRQRAILVAARIDGLLNREIAERFGISESLVEKELRHALRACRDGLRQHMALEDGSTRGRRKF